MGQTVRIQVLMHPEEAVVFDAYCRDRGYKKSTLIARLIREHLTEERFAQPAEPLRIRKGQASR